MFFMQRLLYPRIVSILANRDKDRANKALYVSKSRIQSLYIYSCKSLEIFILLFKSQQFYLYYKYYKYCIVKYRL